MSLKKAFQRRDAEKKSKDTATCRKFLAHLSGNLVFLCVPLLAPRLGVEKTLATAVYRLKKLRQLRFPECVGARRIFSAETQRRPRAAEENPGRAGNSRAPGPTRPTLGGAGLSAPAGQRGLTLIELLVALGIFAVLGLISYRALAAATLSEARLDAATQRWQGLARALRVVDGELLEAATLPGDAASATSAMQLLPASDERPGEFRFLRLDATRGVRRVGFRLREQKLEWLRWEGRTADAAPAVTLLLEPVQALRWRFVQGGQRLEQWPAGSLQNNRLPAAVVVEIELPDLGRFERVFALR